MRHEGGSSAPVALAVPFLLRAAAERSVHNRAQLVLLAAEAGHRNHFGRDQRDDLLQLGYPPEEAVLDNRAYPVQWTLQAAREALGAGAPLLTGLLDDPDPAMRAHAAYALATAASPPPGVHELRTRLAAEHNPSVRISLVLAVTQLAVEQADDPDIVAVVRVLRRAQEAVNGRGHGAEFDRLADAIRSLGLHDVEEDGGYERVFFVKAIGGYISFRPEPADVHVHLRYRQDRGRTSEPA